MKKREKEGRARLPWADLVRAAAIVCVVLCHAAEATFQFIYPDIMVQCSALTQLLAYAAMAVGRMGVPLFLFLSGWFLLARQYDTPGALLFWKRHLPGLVLTAEIWLVLYAVFDAVRPGGIAFSAGRLVRNMTFQEYTQGHMWYMPMILGLYLFVPFVACAVQRLGLRAFAVPVCAAGFFSFVQPPANVVLLALGREPLGGVLSLDFGGGVYGLLLVGGYLARRGCLRRVRAVWLVLAGTACFAGLVWLEFFAYAHGAAYNVRYNCFLLAGQALCLFELLSRVRRVPAGRLAASLARCSFGIYLVHVPVQTLLKPVADGIAVMPLRIVVYFALPLAASWALVHFLGKIPALGRALFYLR